MYNSRDCPGKSYTLHRRPNFQQSCSTTEVCAVVEIRTVNGVGTVWRSGNTAGINPVREGELLELIHSCLESTGLWSEWIIAGRLWHNCLPRLTVEPRTLYDYALMFHCSETQTDCFLCGMVLWWCRHNIFHANSERGRIQLCITSLGGRGDKSWEAHVLPGTCSFFCPAPKWGAFCFGGQTKTSCYFFFNTHTHPPQRLMDPVCGTQLVPTLRVPHSEGRIGGPCWTLFQYFR